MSNGRAPRSASCEPFYQSKSRTGSICSVALLIWGRFGLFTAHTHNSPFTVQGSRSTVLLPLHFIDFLDLGSILTIAMRRYCPPDNEVFGRNEAIELGVATLLDAPSHSILTFTGRPGSGKTRLAVEIASRLTAAFVGVYFVPISDLTSADELAEALARALPIQAGSEQGADRISGKSLYVLDQFDSLGRTGAAALQPLLEDTHRQFLLTARHPLGIPGESIVQVLPLTKTAYEHPAKSTLFDRAGWSAETARSHCCMDQYADGLCDLLEGLPLALELCAGAVSNFELHDIELAIRAHLEQRREGRSLTPQGRALNAAIELASKSLPREQHIFFERLSVFKNEISVQSACAICSSEDGISLLTALRDRYLLAEVGGTCGIARYRIPDTVREFLWARLGGAERAALRTNHAYYFLHVAESWPPDAELEHANFAIALQWCIETENVEMGFRLAHALRGHWQRVGAEQEGRRWLRRLLSIPDSTVPAVVTERAYEALGISGPSE